MRSTCFSFYSLLGLERGPAPLGFLLGILLAVSPSSVQAAPKENDIPCFSPVNDWLYRGGQPSEEALARLKKKGIRTVINFRDDKNEVERERQKVESLGMKYVSLPWNIMKSVKPELLDRFFEVLDRREDRPVFFHCEHGRDRSGVMSMMALMRYEGLSEEEARSQALETIHPHLRYRPFVNQKIKFFLKERRDEISRSGGEPSGG